jgi:hypothetical protein
LILVEKLYFDESFRELLFNLARKNLLPFDDYRQEVFASLSENQKSDAIKEAKRIAMRMARKQQKQNYTPLSYVDGFLPSKENRSELWENSHVLVS